MAAAAFFGSARPPGAAERWSFYTILKFGWSTAAVVSHSQWRA